MTNFYQGFAACCTPNMQYDYYLLQVCLSFPVREINFDFVQIITETNMPKTYIEKRFMSRLKLFNDLMIVIHI